MGVDANLYIGPFAATPKLAKRDVVHDVNGCEACKTEHIPRSGVPLLTKFCEKCGAKLGPYKITKNEAPSLWEVSDGMGERLRFAENFATGTAVTPKFDVWVSNMRDFPPNRPDTDDSFLVEFDAVTMANEIKAFEKYFATELAHLKKACGGVTIRWGMLQWYT